MVHDPMVTLLNKVKTRQIRFISQFIQFQLRADTSGTEMLILLLHLAIQFDLGTVADKLLAMFTVQLKNVLCS